MPTYKIIKLKELSPLHIGTGRETYDFSSADLHSDTLSAALTAMHMQLGTKTDAEQFLRSFTISSAFPYNGNTLFLPKSQNQLKISIRGKEEKDYRKKLKKVKFIELDLWEKLASGKNIEMENDQWLKGDYLASSPTFQALSQSYISQRVTVPRNDIEAEPFFFDWRYFQKESGLYCIIDADNSTFQYLLQLFGYLGEIGIGTDKNVGGGKFTVESSTITLPEIKEAESMMLLSLYIPEREEIQTIKLDQSSYTLVLRNGFIAGSEIEELRHLQKKSIYMFGVGSLFNSSATLKGKIVDLRPSWNDERLHSVYRSGKPFYIPVKF